MAISSTRFIEAQRKRTHIYIQDDFQDRVFDFRPDVKIGPIILAPLKVTARFSKEKAYTIPFSSDSFSEAILSGVEITKDEYNRF